MQLSVITLTYNSANVIVEQLRSVRHACEGASFEHMVVDNGSADGTIALIRKEFPDIRVIENKKNLGFAVGNNVGVQVAAGEFVLFLNPDMRFPVGERLSKWIDWMRAHSDVGISGCKLVNERGGVNLQATPRRFPRPWEIVAILLKIPHLFPKILDSYLCRDRDFTKEQTVDSVRGSCMLVRRELIEKLGHAFDPRYFFWFEDVDLCREAGRFGMKVVYTPTVSCFDLVGQSVKKKNLWWKQKQFTKSAVQYFWKWK